MISEAEKPFKDMGGSKKVKKSRLEGLISFSNCISITIK
jgi:hypothetical protein